MDRSNEQIIIPWKACPWQPKPWIRNLCPEQAAKFLEANKLHFRLVIFQNSFRSPYENWKLRYGKQSNK